MEEILFSCATTGSLRPPVHSPSGGDTVPSGRTRPVGSSAYFLLVTFGFLSGWAPSSVISVRVLIFFLKWEYTALLAQHAIEEEDVESICAETRERRRRRANGSNQLWAPKRNGTRPPCKRPIAGRSLKWPASCDPSCVRVPQRKRRSPSPRSSLQLALHSLSIMSFAGRRRGNKVKKGVQFTVMVVGKSTHFLTVPRYACQRARSMHVHTTIPPSSRTLCQS